MNDGPPASNPFPSPITVSGLEPGTFRVTATIRNATHTFVSDWRVLLVGPNGAKVMLLQVAGGSGDFRNANVTFDDAAPTGIPDNIAIIPPGAYKPSNFGSGGQIHPGTPPGPYASQMAAFGTTNLEGTWQLYAWDAIAGFTGNIAGGWCLDLLPLNAAPVANACRTPGTSATARPAAASLHNTPMPTTVCSPPR